MIAEVVQEEVVTAAPLEPETANTLERQVQALTPAEIETETPKEPSPLPTAFPAAPIRPDAPITDAWNDLRAALSPALGTSSKSDETPATSASAVHELPLIQAPEMPEMYFSMPSSPLLDMEEYDNMPDSVDSDEPLHCIPQPSATEPVGAIPDEICLPTMPHEQTGAHFPAPGFLVTDAPPNPSDPAPSLLARTFAPPVVVPRSALMTTEDSPSSEKFEESKPLTAPVVLPREAQAKKSFFDWLRS